MYRHVKPFLKRSVLKTQTSHQASVDKCRSHRRLQKNVAECRRVTRRVQTNGDESLDQCRQVETSHQTSIDECRRVQTNQFFSFISEKVISGPILLLLQLCNSRPHWYTNFQFGNFQICLLLRLMYMNLNLKLMLKRARFPYT